MRIWLIVAVLAFAGPAWSQEADESAIVLPFAERPISSANVMGNAINAVIRPAFRNFAATSAALNGTMRQLCALPNATNYGAARTAFGESVEAYGRVELFSAGPLRQDSRAERIFFWPDRKGIGLRQVQQVLAEHDESATNLEGLAQKSVALQGLGALEFVLFGTGSEDLSTTGNDQDFRCRFGMTIAGSLDQLSSELAAAWTAKDGIATHLLDPKAAYADYRTPTEAMEALVGFMSHGVEAVRDTRIFPFIGRDGQARPKAAPFWRSGLTMRSIRANLEGLETLFRVSAIGKAVGPDDRDLEDLVTAEFENAYGAIDQVNAPIAEAVKTPAQLAALQNLVGTTQNLQDLIGEQLSAALSLSVGFSALDGD